MNRTSSGSCIRVRRAIAGRVIACLECFTTKGEPIPFFPTHCVLIHSGRAKGCNEPCSEVYDDAKGTVGLRPSR
jgi:hypothetical protein